MGKLRHIAIAVPNTDETAKFYEQAFGMKRVRESVSAIMLSDGVISLAILDNQKSHEALGHSGLHHFGFIADNVDETAGRAEMSGAVYADKSENVAKRFENRGQMEDASNQAAVKTVKVPREVKVSVETARARGVMAPWVMAVHSVCFLGSSLVGGPAFGALAGWIGVAGALRVAALICAAVALGAAVAWRSSRSTRLCHDSGPKCTSAGCLARPAPDSRRPR